MAAPTETRQQEPSQQEQLTDANREEIAAVFAALRTKAIPTNPTYQEEAAKASLGGVGGLNSTGKPVTCELPGEEKPVRVNYLAELTGPLRQILTLDQGSEGGFHADTRLTLSVTTTPAPDGDKRYHNLVKECRHQFKNDYSLTKLAISHILGFCCYERRR